MVLQSVVETQIFLSDAKAAGMDDDERSALIVVLAQTPEIGDIVPGTGGARKLRYRRPGTGKRGGYRVIYYYGGLDVPIFLLNVFAKGDKSDLSKAEQNALRLGVVRLLDGYRRGLPV
jgi:hypothetical protein